MAGLEFVGVRKTYPNGVKAIHGIDMTVSDGEFVVIVGPSGCGKSTLLRMVAGLETVTDGEVRIGENRVNELEPADRNIAMVFQNYALYPHMSVFDNMAYGLRNRRTPRGEIARRVAEAPDPPAGRVARPEARPAVRRPAPARGDGPGHRPRAGGLSLR